MLSFTFLILITLVVLDRVETPMRHGNLLSMKALDVKGSICLFRAFIAMLAFAGGRRLILRNIYIDETDNIIMRISRAALLV